MIHSNPQSPPVQSQYQPKRRRTFSPPPCSKFQEVHKFIIDVSSEFLDRSDLASMFQVCRDWRKLLLAKSEEENKFTNRFLKKILQFFNSNFPNVFSLPIDLIFGRRVFPIDSLSETEEFRFPLDRKNRIMEIGKRIFVTLNLRNQILIPSSQIRGNKELILIAISIDYSLYNYAAPKLMKDREVVLATIKHNTSYSNINADFILSPFLPEDLLNDRDFILEVLEIEGLELRNVPDPFKDDEVCVLTAVKNRGVALGYASERLRKDRNVVLAAAYNDANALEYASADLLHNKSFIIELFDNFVSLYMELYQTLPGILRLDRDITVAFLLSDDRFFETLPDHLKDDERFVFAALMYNPNSIQFASSRWQNNPNMLRRALKCASESNKPFNFDLIPPDLLSDKAFVLKAVKYGLPLSKVDKKFCNYKDVLQAAIEKDTNSLEHISPRLKRDKEMAYLAFRINSKAIDFFHIKFQNDPKAVLMAVKLDGRNILKASPTCQASMPLVLEAVSKDPSVLKDLIENQRNNPEIVKAALLRDSGVDFNLKRNFVLEHTERPPKDRPIKHMGTSLKQNREFMLDIVKINGLFFYYAHADLKMDRVLIFAAAANNYRVIELIPNELLFDNDFLVDFFKRFEYLKDNYFFALSAVSVNPNIFPFLSSRLRDNTIVLMSALQKITLNKNVPYETFFPLISDRLKQDFTIIQQVVFIWPCALKDISHTLRHDKNILTIAFTTDGLSLNFASSTIQDDEFLVSLAVISNGLALRYASPRLQQNRAIVGLAIKQNASAFQFVSSEL